MAVIAYFCGCFNGAVIVSKYILRDDVRNHGSGNAGLTNFYRTFGGPLTLVVILCDVLKAVVAVLLGSWLLGTAAGANGYAASAQISAMWALFGEYWAAVFCLLGHMFPCMFHFKGGKGILSGGTIVWMIDWRIGLVVWGGLSDPVPADEVCVPGIRLGRGQLSLCHLVLLSGSGHCDPGVHPGRTGAVEASGQHRPAHPRQ